MWCCPNQRWLAEVDNGADVPGNSHHIPVALSTFSVHPLDVPEAFAAARDLGYDGVEVMVTRNPASQKPQALLELGNRYQLPITSIHAPTMLPTQQVWGSARNKIEMSCRMAREVGCGTVVTHPPFRWQGNFAKTFKATIRQLADMYHVHIAVENMYPWRVRGRETALYLPHWDPLGQEYDDVTWDFSHAAIAGVDSADAMKALGNSLRHVHLSDSLGSSKDEHLVPGRGSQRCAEALQFLAANKFEGTVVAEISTKKAKSPDERNQWLAETLVFARKHLSRPLVGSV
jgi:sugar phosphate isomerase/epimerase